MADQDYQPSNPMAAMMLNQQASSPSAPTDTAPQDTTQPYTPSNPIAASMIGIKPQASTDDATEAKNKFDRGLAGPPPNPQPANSEPQPNENMVQRAQNERSETLRKDLPFLNAKTGQTSIDTTTNPGSSSIDPIKALQEFQVRGSESFLSKPEDKAALWKKFYPDGDFVTSKDTGANYFRMNSTDPYSLYDRDVRLGELNAPQNITRDLTIAAAGISKTPGIIWGFAKTAAKTAAIDLGLDEGMKVAGSSTETQGAIVQKAAMDAGMNGVADAVGKWVTGAANGFTGRGVMGLDDNQVAMRKWLNDNGYRDLIAPQVMKNPAFMKWAQLASGLDTHISEALETQTDDLIKEISKAGGSTIQDIKGESHIQQLMGTGMSRETAVAKLGLDASRFQKPVPMPPALNDYFEQYKTGIKDLFLKDPMVSMGDGGRAANSIVDKYTAQSGAWVNQLYTNLRNFAQGDVNFNIDDAINQAQKFKAGDVTNAKPNLDENGRPIIGNRVPLVLDSTAKLAQGDPLRQAIDQLTQMDPNLRIAKQAVPQVVRDANGAVIPNAMEQTATTPYEQIHAIRSRLFDALYDTSNTRVPFSDNEKRMVSKIIDSLTNSLEAPVGNGSTDFKKALQEANSAASERFDYLKNANTLKAFRAEAQDRVAQLMEGLDNRNADASLTVLHNMAGQIDTMSKGTEGANAWKTVQGAAVSNLMQKPETIVQRLGNLDPATRLSLLGPTGPSTLDESLTNYGTAMKRLQDSGIEKTLEKNSTYMSQIMDLASRGGLGGDRVAGTRAVDEVVKFAQSDPTGRAAEAVKGGIIQNLFDRIVQPKGGLTIQNDVKHPNVENLIADYVNQIQSSGFGKLFSNKELVDLKMAAAYAGFIKSQTADVGMSLQTAAVAVEASRLEPRAFMHLIEAKVAGATMVNQGKVQRFVMGDPANPKAGQRFDPYFAQAITSLAERSDPYDLASLGLQGAGKVIQGAGAVGGWIKDQWNGGSNGGQQ